MPMPVILIVDDAVENVLMLKHLLNDIGKIVFAKDGETALEQAARHKPDLVLLDVVMPGIDGHETCRRLKADPATRDIPVIFITGNDAEDDEARGLALGAIDYITKPFAPAIVRARVKNHLALVQAHADLRSANTALRKFKAAVDSSSAAILITDCEARIEYVNAAFTDITGYDAAEMMGSVPELLRNGATVEDETEGERELWQVIMNGSTWRGELCRGRKDGSLLWEDIAIAPVYDDAGAITHIVSVNSDITRRKAMEEELRQQAITDALTGLANRRRLMEAGAHEVKRSLRSGEPLSLLIADIDHFKRVNDTLGHTAGDAVIRQIGEISASEIRSFDTAGRLGGEEFAVILPLTDATGAYELAERLRARIATSPAIWEGKPIHASVSIGVAQADPDNATFVSMLSRADDALYEAKRAGRDCVCVARETPRTTVRES
jgi:diguanylate cyclase (GGDEF)-like protein/PAS domain S-box-containing protein